MIKKAIKYFRVYFLKEEKELRKISNKPRFSNFKTFIFEKGFTGIDSPSFIGQYREIIQRGVYSFLTNKKEPLIIDCGSNIGISIIAFKKMYPNAKVIAFEPDKSIYKILMNNINSLNLTNVKIYNAAVWSEDTTLLFFQQGAAGGKIISSDNEKIENNRIIKIPAIDLSRYINTEIDFLKIDIEGAEIEVIKNIDNKLHYVNNLFIEYHSKVLEKQRLQDLLTILSKNNFRYFIETGYPLSKTPFIKKMAINDFDNLLNIYAINTKK